VLYQMYTAVLY
jgi:hypothetical protein